MTEVMSDVVGTEVDASLAVPLPSPLLVLLFKFQKPCMTDDKICPQWFLRTTVNLGTHKRIAWRDSSEIKSTYYEEA